MFTAATFATLLPLLEYYPVCIDTSAQPPVCKVSILYGILMLGLKISYSIFGSQAVTLESHLLLLRLNAAAESAILLYVPDYTTNDAPVIVQDPLLAPCDVAVEHFPPVPPLATAVIFAALITTREYPPLPAFEPAVDLEPPLPIVNAAKYFKLSGI